MIKQPFVFKVRLTPMGKHYVELFEGLVKIGVSCQTYGSAEEALHDIREALEHRTIANKIVKTVQKII